MEANGGGEGLEDELVMVVSSAGLVAWVPAQAVAQNGGDAIAAAEAQDVWVPAEAAWAGVIPATGMVVPEDEYALAVVVWYGWMDPFQALDLELEWSVAPRIVPNNQAAEDAYTGNAALYLVFLCLPAREIERCRRVCRVWRDITSTDDFRRHHHEHHFRTPMPLFFFLDPKLRRLNLQAVDIRDRVPRPVTRYTRPSNNEVGEVLRIHGSCAGILLLSSGPRLYACNPCTRRWAPLPPLHVYNDIIGFYVTGHGDDIECQVLYHDRVKSNCTYWMFTLAAAEALPGCIGRPGTGSVELDLVLAKGIVPSYKIPPVFLRGFLLWPPKAAQDNSNILLFDTVAESFDLIPPPRIQVGGEAVPVVDRQLFEIDDHLAMTVISFSPARVDVWVRSNHMELWCRWYSIRLPLDEINLNDSCHHNASVFAIAQDRNDLVQCPCILLQCDALGAVLQTYQLDDHWISLSGHTLEESLLLHPNILWMLDTDAVDGDPPFFGN